MYIFIIIAIAIVVLLLLSKFGGGMTGGGYYHCSSCSSCNSCGSSCGSSCGGGCGGGGTASVHCPVAGNPGVAHRNEGLTPGDLAWLVMSTTQGNATCGSCTLVPAIAGGFTFSAVAGPDGVAQVTTSVPANPALVGLVYWEQWIRFPGTANCLLGVDLSTALEVTVE